MNNNLIQDPGLYWRPLGGNNIDQISGHCYQYTGVVCLNGKTKTSTIVVDLGKFDNHQALGIKNSVAAVPDLRDILEDKTLNLKGLFLTHSHPDHLNGIIIYLKAGYKLPVLYGSKYTKLILENLYEFYKIGKTKQPTFIEIADGDKLNCGCLNIEVLSASHTCFDALSFVISDKTTSVFHTGDFKIDQTTYFRKPTNIRRIASLSDKINFIVGDFYGIDNEGFAWREADVFKRLCNIIKKSRKQKIFLPVYPTHIEMYVLSFLAALKNKKNVIFYGSEDFYAYLNIIKKYGIDFERLSKGKIKIFEEIPSDAVAKENCVVIGDFNDIGYGFRETDENAFGVITAKTFFNPLKGQMNSRNIRYVTLDDEPILQGAGHGFFEDWKYIQNLLPNAVYIPTHCPCFVAESFKTLAEAEGFDLINPIPKNNQLFKLFGNKYELLSTMPACWLVNTKENAFTEVWQKPTSGEGFLKRTFSKRRTNQKFKMMLCKRRNKKCKTQSL